MVLVKIDEETFDFPEAKAEELVKETSLKVEPSLIMWSGNAGRTGIIPISIDSITKTREGFPIEICVTNEGLRKIEKVRIFLGQHDFLIHNNHLDLENVTYSEPPKCGHIFIKKHGCVGDNSGCSSKIENNETRIVFTYVYERKQGEYPLKLCLFESNNQKSSQYCYDKANWKFLTHTLKYPKKEYKSIRA